MRPFKAVNKYRAKRTGNYASKREAEYAAQLKLRKQATNGDVLYWVEQVPIRMSIGKYVCDFLVFMRDGSHQYVEVKGFETPAWRKNCAALEIEHPEVWERLQVVK